MVEIVQRPRDLARAPRRCTPALAWGKSRCARRRRRGHRQSLRAAVLAEGLRLLAERAADAATLDAVLRRSRRLQHGAVELIDLIGLDVNLAVRRASGTRASRSALRAVGGCSRSVWRRGSGTQDRARVLRLWRGRGQARAIYRGQRQPAPARVTAHGDLGMRRISSTVSGGRRRGRARARRFAISRRKRSPSRAMGVAHGSRLPTGARRPPALSLQASAISWFSTWRSTTRMRHGRRRRADTCSDPAYASAVGALQASRCRGLPSRRRGRACGVRVVAMLRTKQRTPWSSVALPDAIDLAWKRVSIIARTARVGGCNRRGHGSRRDRQPAAHYGEDLYRVSPLVARRAASGEKSVG